MFFDVRFLSCLNIKLCIRDALMSASYHIEVHTKPRIKCLMRFEAAVLTPNAAHGERFSLM